MMVVDTHALIWWLAGGSALSTPARRALKRATAVAPAVASTISVLIATAARRGRLKLSVPLDRWLDDAQLLELRFEPVSVEIARTAGAFPSDMHGDPADRLNSLRPPPSSGRPSLRETRSFSAAG
jgi:PIN domain nuclease of toxin-antitoxin system